MDAGVGVAPRAAGGYETRAAGGSAPRASCGAQTAKKPPPGMHAGRYEGLKKSKAAEARQEAARLEAERIKAEAAAAEAARLEAERREKERLAAEKAAAMAAKIASRQAALDAAVKRPIPTQQPSAAKPSVYAEPTVKRPTSATQPRPTRPSVPTDPPAKPSIHIHDSTGRARASAVPAAKRTVALPKKDTLDFGIHAVEGFACMVMLPEGESVGDSHSLSELSPHRHPRLVEFVVQGPRDAVDCLTEAVWEGQAVQLVGHMSPVNAVSLDTFVERGAALSMGIPKKAAFFAFVYPCRLLHNRQRRLLEIVGSRLGSECLVNTPPWLDLLLTGGYVYFDKAGTLLRANALGQLKARSAGTISLIYSSYTAHISLISRSYTRRYDLAHGPVYSQPSRG